MRWYRPKYGSFRIVKKFALFPITIDGETRWLENVCIRQWRGYSVWLDDAFVDEE